MRCPFIAIDHGGTKRWASLWPAFDAFQHQHQAQGNRCAL
jgi:hypothetical protein